MLIAVSGTPGTGKTRLSKRLARELGLDYVSLGEFAREHNLITGRDKKRQTDEVDVARLKRFKFSDAVLDGHFSHDLKADVKIILRLHPKKLSRRLKTKGWSEKKIRENCEAEAMGIIADEAKDSYEILSDRSMVDNALLAVKGKLKKTHYDFWDWL